MIPNFTDQRKLRNGGATSQARFIFHVESGGSTWMKKGDGMIINLCSPRQFVFSDGRFLPAVDQSVSNSIKAQIEQVEVRRTSLGPDDQFIMKFVKPKIQLSHAAKVRMESLHKAYRELQQSKEPDGYKFVVCIVPLMMLQSWQAVHPEDDHCFATIIRSGERGSNICEDTIFGL